MNRTDRLRWGAFAFGALALCFSNGATANVYAAWIAPALLLGFVMTTGPWLGFVLTVAASSVASFVMFRGVVPIGDEEYVIASAVTGLIGALPFFAHRLAAPQLGAALGSLVFPTVAVALSYVLSLGSPFGTWGNDAYVQLAFAPLVQFASVAGIWGVAFVVYWFAGVAQALVTERSSGATIAAATFAAVFISLIWLGASRLDGPTETSGTVRAAALSNPRTLPDRFFEGCTQRTDYACRSAKARARQDILFALSEQAVQQGAKLIVWYEAAAQFDAPDEAEFIARAGAFARKHGVYLIAGAARIPSAPDQLIANMAIGFTPEGVRAFEYLKTIPVPGEPIIRGDGVIPALDTPFGRLGVMICFDADFPALSRQAAARGVDILVIPANDWRAITPLHAEMTRMRAIESGFSIVRATSNGVSLITDQRGTVLARNNSFTDPGAITIADVPARRLATAQSTIDDLFAALCMVLASALLIFGAALALRARSGRRNQ
ncbi:MAG: nitrilase-related carbon-nitrogen hydrolase [Alphaproteobacteria bacterium]|nr:nitrilase-related carbon-nitrogen hydrolase [Alphaproteobacteria bacterium]